MTNIEYEIDKKYQDFIASYDHTPEYLYLGVFAYSALVQCIVSDANFSDPEIPISERPYKGMKIIMVLNEDNHVNCA